MAKLLANNFRFRRTYSKTPHVPRVQNLIEMQKRVVRPVPAAGARSRRAQGRRPPGRVPQRVPDRGLQRTGASLQFVSYELEPPKYDVDECRERGMTFSAPIKVTVRLVVWEVDPETGTPHGLDIKESAGLLRRDPADDRERHVHRQRHRARRRVSQLHRCPGIFFDSSRSKTGGASKTIFSARIIPNRGSWIDFEFDTKDILYVRIDRRRKLPGHGAPARPRLRHRGSAQLLLRARAVLPHRRGLVQGDHRPTCCSIQKASVDVIAPETASVDPQEGQEVPQEHPRGRCGRPTCSRDEVARSSTAASAGRGRHHPDRARRICIGKVSAYDIVDMETGRDPRRVQRGARPRSTSKLARRARHRRDFEVLFIDGLFVGSFLRDTLLVDKIASTEEAIIEIYRRLRRGDPADLRRRRSSTSTTCSSTPSATTSRRSAATS